MQKKERITKILEHLNHGIYERNETISVSLLAALAEQNIFLFGPPGTAKSLISRRLAQAFETNHYFEYLMQRFSTPEEVFGPVSLSELKKDNYVRKTNGFLPKADFAFLDEIWKSSPAILNTLLTILNEKIFRNGSELEKVPLKALISASNEIPPEKQGLEALYDRFLVRLHVPPMEEKTHFETLLQSKPTKQGNKLPYDLLIKNQEWEQWKSGIEETKLSDEVLNIISDILLTFSEKTEELNLYVSDRRWQRAAIFLKASAFFCERKETNLVDALLLKHCLWTTEENRETVSKIVEDAVRNCGFEIELDLTKIDQEKQALEDEIHNESFYHKTTYETVQLPDGQDYFKITNFKSKIDPHHNRHNLPTEIYIPLKEMGSEDKFHPVTQNLEAIQQFQCNFSDKKKCNIKEREPHYHNDWSNHSTYKPKVLHKKGAKKEINPRLRESLQIEVLKIAEIFEKKIKEVQEKLTSFEKEIDTPFVLKEDRKIALESIEQQIEDLQLRQKDCERIMNLIE